MIVYTIRDFDEVAGLVTVEFQGGSRVAITLPRDGEGNFPVGDALDQICAAAAPADLSPPASNAHEIHALVNEERVAVVTPAVPVAVDAEYEAWAADNGLPLTPPSERTI